jgi:hypothetical protein
MDRQAADVLNRPNRISQIDGRLVHDADGRRLGHVFDLACAWTPGAACPPIDELIYGSRGLLERLGWRRSRPASVPWRRLLRIDAKGVALARDGD